MRAAPIIAIDAPSPAAPSSASSAEPPKVVAVAEPLKVVAVSPVLEAKVPEPATNGAISAAAFAKTMAISPEGPMPPLPSVADSVTGSTMEVPAAAERRGDMTRSPVELESSLADRASTPGELPLNAFPVSSILNRLRAPTRWRRSAWVATWAGLTLALALLVGALAFGRPRSSAKNAAVTAMTVAPAAILPAPPVTPVALPEPAQPAPIAEVTPPEPAQPAPIAAAPSPKADATAHAAKTAKPPAKPIPKGPAHVSMAEDFSLALRKRHLGRLTIHSLASYAKVYMMFTKYGKVEERLTVPCGRRFMAIGLPAPTPHREPIWLAPGETIDIPCGGSLEVTMNPRKVRKVR
jgi:hypothetical protein